MSSIASDQDLHPHTTRNLCIETAPAGLVAIGGVAAGAASGQWWIHLLALIPASAAARHVHRTLRNERTYAMTRWLVAEVRWRRRQRTATAELEDTAARTPTVVDGTVTEHHS